MPKLPMLTASEAEAMLLRAEFVWQVTRMDQNEQIVLTASDYHEAALINARPMKQGDILE